VDCKKTRFCGRITNITKLEGVMSLTNELNFWKYEKKCLKTIEALQKNGFKAQYFKERKEAISYINEQIKSANVIGIGGSMTIAELGLHEIFQNAGKEVLNHNVAGLSPHEKVEIMRRALLSDAYFCSSNAITTDGKLINIDATGNRVGTMLFGPKKVFIVAGRNKIVEDDVNTAIKRVKDWASPPNAKRLSFKTPCAETGFCADCNSPDRICRIITIIERKPRITDVEVVLINEDLGF